MIPDICDEKIYIPINLERFDYKNIKDRKLIGIIIFSVIKKIILDSGKNSKKFKVLQNQRVKQILSNGRKLTKEFKKALARDTGS